ncbi:MAG: hypothetical protein ABIJ75_03655 [Actinomycetota bacterium]
MRRILIIFALLAVACAGTAEAQSWMPTVSILGRLANLPSGTVIAYDSSDVTITHSANTLTLAGGVLVLPSGTAAAPPLGVGQADAGLHSPGANRLAFGTAGTGGGLLDGTGVAVKSTGLIGFLDSDTLASGSVDSSFTRSAAGHITTGTFSSLRPVQTIAGTGAITACKGHTVNVTAAGTATLPSGATVGQNCSVVSTTAAVVSIDVASGSDTMILNGTALTAGYKATSDGTDEATLYCEVSVANTWRCRTTLGIHTDGGA